MFLSLVCLAVCHPVCLPASLPVYVARAITLMYFLLLLFETAYVLLLAVDLAVMFTILPLCRAVDSSVSVSCSTALPARSDKVLAPEGASDNTSICGTCAARCKPA